MSDLNTPDPHDRTRRLGEDGSAAALPADRTQRLDQDRPAAVSPADPTRPVGAAGPPGGTAVRPGGANGADRTKVMPGGSEHEQPIAYTEDYSDQLTPGRDLPRSGPAGPLDDDGADSGRTFSVTALVLSVIAALLVGAIMTLLLLPEEEPQVLADQAVQAALAQAQAQNAEQATRIAELEAQVVDLQAQVAQRDQTIAEQQQALAEGGEAVAADQVAADQAAAERDAALAQREAALAQREAALETREAQVAAREEAVATAEQNTDTGGGGFELPEVGDLEIPVELPEIDEEEARGLVERFVDRLASFFD